MSNGLPVVPRAIRRFRRWAYGPHGDLNETWRELIESDPEGKRFVVGMDLLFGQDVPVRAATSRLATVSGNDGSAHDYPAALTDEPEVTFSYTFGSAAASASSLSFAIPNKLIDAGAIIAGGRVLAGLGEIALLAEGIDHDERYVLMRGDMDSGVSYGNLEDGVVAGSLTDPKETADLSLPLWVVDTERWPNADESAIGKAYPVVVNRFDDIPGLIVSVTRTGDVVDSIDFLAAYGHGWTISTTSGVKLQGVVWPAASAARSWAQVETTDAWGTPVTLVRWTPGTETWSEDLSESVHITVSGGLGAKDLIKSIEYLAQNFSLLSRFGLNTRMFASALAKLGPVDARICANASGGGADATVFEFIESQVLQSFPMVSMAFQNGGYGPIVTDINGHKSAALIANVPPLMGYANTDPVETAKSALYNNFTLRYGYLVVEDTFEGVATRHGQNSDLCALMEQQVGTRTHPVIESRWITTATVAEYVVDWMVEHLSVPSYYVEYPCTPWVLLYLALGDNVTITDDRLGYTATTATVEKITYRRGVCTIGLRVWLRYYSIGGGSSTASGLPTQN